MFMRILHLFCLTVCLSVRPTDRLFICEMNERKLCTYVVLWSRSWNVGVLRGYVCTGYGTARHGTARHDTTLYGTLRHVLHGTIRCVRHGRARYGTACLVHLVSTMNMELKFRCHFQEVRKSAAIYRHRRLLLVVNVDLELGPCQKFPEE
jgi:hypothetical protein